MSLGTISEDQTHSESAIASCVSACSRVTMFAQVQVDINNCFYEGNETAQKLLAELEQVQDAKSRAAEAANAEMVAKPLPVR